MEAPADEHAAAADAGAYTAEEVRRLTADQLRSLAPEELMGLLAAHEADLDEGQLAVVAAIIDEDESSGDEAPRPRGSSRDRGPEIVYEGVGAVSQPPCDVSGTSPVDGCAPGEEVVYEALGRQPTRRESRFRGTQQLHVAEGSNDVDPYAFLPGTGAAAIAFRQGRSGRRGSSCAPRLERTSSADERPSSADSSDPNRPQYTSLLDAASEAASEAVAAAGDDASTPPPTPPAKRRDVLEELDVEDHAALARRARKLAATLVAAAADGGAEAKARVGDLARSIAEAPRGEELLLHVAVVLRGDVSADAAARAALRGVTAELVRRRDLPDLLPRLQRMEAAAARLPAAARSDSSDVAKAGLLRKRGTLNTAWRTRWVEVWPKHGRLYYFRNYGDDKCRGYIEVANGGPVDVSEADADDAPYAFAVSTPGGKHGSAWLLQAASATERDEWIREIRALALVRRDDGGADDGPGQEGRCVVS